MEIIIKSVNLTLTLYPGMVITLYYSKSIRNSQKTTSLSIQKLFAFSSIKIINLFRSKSPMKVRVSLWKSAAKKLSVLSL